MYAATRMELVMMTKAKRIAGVLVLVDLITFGTGAIYSVWIAIN